MGSASDYTRSAAYWTEVSSIAWDLLLRTCEGEMVGEDDVYDDVQNTVDGHECVIYTGHALNVLRHTSNFDAWADMAGEPVADLSGFLSACACAALRADIIDTEDHTRACTVARDLHTHRKAIFDGMMRAVHACAWSDAEERQGRDHGGSDILDLMDEVTTDSARWAAELLAELIEDNGVDLEDVAKDLSEKDAEDLGHYLAMEAMGQGVAWSDSHEDHCLNVPHRERLNYECHGRGKYCVEMVRERSEAIAWTLHADSRAEAIEKATEKADKSVAWNQADGATPIRVENVEALPHE